MLGDQRSQTTWSVDPEALVSLRLEQARAALRRGEVDQAIVEAEELLDEHPDHSDALFLVGDGSLELQDAATAHAAFSRYLQLVPDDPVALSGFAVSAFELTLLEDSLAAAERAVMHDPALAEAWYFRGLCLERMADMPLAQHCFSRAHALDGATYPLIHSISDREWDEALHQALELLPTDLRRWYVAVPLRTLHYPDVTELRASHPPLPPTASALYEGPAPEPELDPWEVRPRSVRLYRGNLQRTATFEGDLTLRIAQALRHEALDWLALPPDALPLAR